MATWRRNVWTGSSTSKSRRRALSITEARQSGAFFNLTREDGTEPPRIHVDRVNKVLDVLPDPIESRPSFGLGLRADLAKGMIRHNGNFVVIHDTDRTVSTERRICP